MIQSNTSSPRGDVSTFWVPESVMAVEVPQNEGNFWRREEWREKKSRFCHPLEKKFGSGPEISKLKFNRTPKFKKSVSRVDQK